MGGFAVGAGETLRPSDKVRVAPEGEYEAESVFCGEWKSLSPSSPFIRGLPLSTYALRGRGGVGPNADVVLRLSKRGCVNLRTRGEGGSKKPKNLRTYLMEAP